MALAGCKVDQHGNQRLVKKVSANKKLLSDAKDAFNAYVVFADEAAAAAALAANNRVVGDKHIRVDRVGHAAARDPKRTVFLGNVPYDAGEEEVRAHFAAALAGYGGEEAIEAVRLVRDPETQVGKGFGFVLFRDRATVAAALRLHGGQFRNRELRVTTCGKRARQAGGKDGGGDEGKRRKPKKPATGAVRRLGTKAKKGSLAGVAGAVDRASPKKAKFEGRRGSEGVGLGLAPVIRLKKGKGKGAKAGIADKKKRKHKSAAASAKKMQKKARMGDKKKLKEVRGGGRR